jgi:hypothetical protein
MGASDYHGALAMNRLVLALAFTLSFPIVGAAAQDWRVSFIPGTTDPAGNVLDATEVRHFAVLPNPVRLFASLGNWMDQATPPGSGKVIRLDSSAGPWRQEVDFDAFCPTTQPRCTIAASALQTIVWGAQADGTPVNNVNTLVAGTWTFGQGNIRAYVKNNSDGLWYQTLLGTKGYGEVRVFGTHQDTVTGKWLGFAAGKPYIFVGQLANDRRAGRNIIDWVVGEQNAEADFTGLVDPNCKNGDVSQRRVSSMAEARGRLFVTVCWKIFVRNDGDQGACKPSEVAAEGACKPRWALFWDDPQSCQSETALRGLTTVQFGGQDVLIVGGEGSCARITRIDPTSGDSVTELATADFLSNLWGFQATYPIAPYNSPMPLVFDSTGRGRRLIGVESFRGRSPLQPGRSAIVLDTGAFMEGDGWFIVRNAASSYQLEHIPAISTLPLMAVRDAIASPFADECDANGRNCWVYFAGFDGNWSKTQTPCRAQPCTVPPQVVMPTHNTGWIVKGRPIAPALLQ